MKGERSDNDPAALLGKTAVTHDSALVGPNKIRGQAT
jgi:hypothetical protein